MTYFQYELRVPLAEFDRMAAQQILSRIKVMRIEQPLPKMVESYLCSRIQILGG